MGSDVDQGVRTAMTVPPVVLDEALRIAIIHELGVIADVDVEFERARRVELLLRVAADARATTFVLGVSGGVDSATAGMLCRQAATTAGLAFVAVRLPYGVQLDEADAQLALSAMQPDHLVTVDVQPASDALMRTVQASGAMSSALEPGLHDRVLGNVKARQRMIAQYAIANGIGGLVVGTDHAAEALVGFFTKYGDGGVDVTPLSGLTKRQVRALGKSIGVPSSLLLKTPTADLESLRPGLPDEEALGVSYDEIDDFLEGRPVSADAAERLLGMYRATRHKRALPWSPSSF